ncbi:MAG: ABC transporter ATP-binding protein [Rhodospirillaceae bacterium]|nr:ABC transporter ATP-binding protein [Rhodospirillaceae bacterium]
MAAIGLPAAAPSAQHDSDVLVVDQVVRRFGDVVAVDRASLSVGAGEIVCLVGPSGCGKTTLLRLVAGLEPPQAGSIRLSGRMVADAGGGLPPEDRGVGLVFQDYALFPHLTVLQNVRFGLARAAPRKQLLRAEAILERVGMAGLAHAYPHTLSGGQQQRVALARALAPEPNVLLMDEPFSGLDLNLRRSVREETLRLLKDAKAATLIVTHDPEEAMHLADRIVLMRQGRIVQTGSPVDLYCRPESAFAAAFFGEVNRLSAKAKGGQVDTPLGLLPAPDLADGEIAEVLVRPEGLSIADASTDPDGVTATIVDAKPIGRWTVAHLVVGGAEGTLQLVMRVPGVRAMNRDTSVAIRTDRSQAFVFRAESR